MNGGLHFVTGATLADPDDAVAGLPASVEDSDHVAGAKFGIEAGEERSTQADFAGVSFLEEAIAASVDAPNREDDVDIGTRFATAVFVSPVDGSEISHSSSFTLTLHRLQVKIRGGEGGTKVGIRCFVSDVFRNGNASERALGPG